MLFKRLLQNGVPYDMTEFSNLFSKFILSKNISVYSLAKYCNLDRSTIYKIRKGERNPSSPELVEKFSEFLHLTPQEHQCLMEAYEITLVGTDTYYRRKSIRDFLMQFPNSFTLRPSGNPGINGLSLGSTAFDTASPCLSLQNQFDINRILGKIFSYEINRENGEISLLLQPEYPFIFNLLENMSIPDTVKINHIFCLNNTDILTSDYKSVHMEYLKMIFPMYIQNLNYQAYCFYDNVQSHFHNMNLFPCLILTSEYALAVSSDFQSGIFYKEPGVVSQLHEFFQNTMANCLPLFHVLKLSAEKLDTLFDVTLSTQNAEKNYLLQPEACFTPFISDEIVNHALLPELSDRDQFFKVIKDYFASISRIIIDQPTLVFFTKNGIDRFIETGCLREIPDGFARPFLPEERIQMLEAFLPYCRNGVYHMLKAPLDQFPVNLHLCINDQLGFLTFENAAGETLYFIINEPGFLMLFIDYMESLEAKKDSCLFSPEETEKFIQSKIDLLNKK